MKEYRALLSELKDAIDRSIGPLHWQIEDDDEHPSPLYLASGVDVPNIDRRLLTDNVNSVLFEHGFPEQPEPQGSPSGHLIIEATDGAGVEVHILVKMGVDMWYTLPK